MILNHLRSPVTMLSAMGLIGLRLPLGTGPNRKLPLNRCKTFALRFEDRRLEILV